MTELPTTFGKYYLTEKLATGGMAEIYLAKLIGPGGFEKSLVIKQILPRLSGQRHFVDLFVAEAKTLVALTHGNIVPVYELGVVDDTYFIAMEYIDGPTLYRLTERMAGRDAVMEPNVAAWITARILEGLDYAHRKGEGVIHRDLSPRNVMLSRDGEVKLVDFGIAVTLGEPGEGESAQSAPTGSFPYMSPEQVRREPLNGQTDLFSAGVLCWEMLVGQRLFARMDPDATLDAVVRGDIARPSLLRPEVPARLEEVVMRALERDQAARWRSAGEMLAPLNRYLYSLDETPGPRDVGALVARFCPPETRRLPTHADAPVHDADDSAPLAGPSTDAAPPPGPSTAVIARDAPPPGPSTAVTARDAPPPGPSTTVTARDAAPPNPSTPAIPNDGPRPRGKRPQRHQTFATNVELEGMLSRATPLFPIDAIRDTPEPGAMPDPGASSDTDASSDAGATPDRRADVEETAADRRGMIAPKLALPGRAPPSRALLVVVGFGGLALAAGAIYVFYQGRSAVLGRDAPADMTSADAGANAPGDGAVADGSAVEVPAAVPDAAPDAAIVLDAPMEGARPDAPRRAAVDAGLVIARDASVRPARDAALARTDAASAGTATLSIGADPWGDITIDGKPYGHTPREVLIAPGHHTVEVVFPAESPPRRQTFAVDVGAGEIKPIQADFH